MNTCELTRRVGAYLDGEMSAEEVGRMGEHLASCGQCAAERVRLEEISKGIGGLRFEPIDPEAVERIHRAVESAGSIRAMARLVESLSALAAGLALAVGVWSAMFSGHGVRAMASLPAWEQAAISSGGGEAGGATGEEPAMADWMVKDLSAGGASRE